MNDKVKKETKTPTRDDLRAQLLGKAHKPESRIITLWDTEIELRQASLKDIVNANASESAEVNAVNMVVRYAYVPGTNERIFEDADRDVILGWPFGKDMQRLQEVVAELSGITEEKLEEIKEELQDNPLKG